MYVVKKEKRDCLGWKKYNFLDENGRFSNRPRFFDTKEEAVEVAKKYENAYAWEWGIDKWMN